MLYISCMQGYVEVTDVKGTQMSLKCLSISRNQAKDVTLKRVFEKSVNRNAFTVHHSHTDAT